MPNLVPLTSAVQIRFPDCAHFGTGLLKSRSSRSVDQITSDHRHQGKQHRARHAVSGWSPSPIRQTLAASLQNLRLADGERSPLYDFGIRWPAAWPWEPDDVDKSEAGKDDDKPAASASRSSSRRHFYGSKRLKDEDPPPKPQASTMSQIFGNSANSSTEDRKRFRSVTGNREIADWLALPFEGISRVPFPEVPCVARPKKRQTGPRFRQGNCREEKSHVPPLPPIRRNGCLVVGFLTVGYADLRAVYGDRSWSTSLACDAGLQTLLCKSRALATTLFRNSVFGITALIIAVLHLIRPSILLLTLGLIAAGSALYFTTSFCPDLRSTFILGFARPAPATAAASRVRKSRIHERNADADEAGIDGGQNEETFSKGAQLWDGRLLRSVEQTTSRTRTRGHRQRRKENRHRRGSNARPTAVSRHSPLAL